MNIVTSIGTECETGALSAASADGTKIVNCAEGNIFFTALALLPVVLPFDPFGNFVHRVLPSDLKTARTSALKQIRHA